MKKTIIDLFEGLRRKVRGKDIPAGEKHRAFRTHDLRRDQGAGARDRRGAGRGGHTSRGQSGDTLGGCNAWITSELGVFYAGAVSVPLSVKLEESNDLLFRMRHAEVRALFVSKYQLSKIRRIRAELPQVEHIIVIGHMPLEAGETALGTLRRMGRDYLAANREEFLAIGRSIRNDDYATITYTSGTTADPKGVVLTHRNYTANVEQSLSRIDIPPYYRTLIILPLELLLRACRGVLYHDRMRGDGRNRAGGSHADGNAEEHPAEHPRGAAAFPAVGAGAGQEFPQEHRVFDPRQGAFHGTALQFRAPHGLCLQQGRVQQRDTAGA